MPEMNNYRIVIKSGIQRVQKLLDQKQVPLFVSCLIAVSLEGLFLVFRSPRFRWQLRHEERFDLCLSYKLLQRWICAYTVYAVYAVYAYARTKMKCTFYTHVTV